MTKKQQNPLPGVSLVDEINEIRDAIMGTALLADVVAYMHAPTERDQREAPRWIGALLAMVTTRLTNVERMLRGEMDPWLLVARHNRTDVGTEAEDGEDVVLRPWDSKGTVASGKPEQRRAT